MTKDYAELVASARRLGASDIHISEGLPLMMRVDGKLQTIGQYGEGEDRALILSLLDENQRDLIDRGSDVDFADSTPDGSRQRINVFRQRGALAATIRLLQNTVPNLEDLELPKVLLEIAERPRGLFLVTGPTGSGKTTTLAAMIDHINQTQAQHILTIEDPIEYVYQQRRSLIHQREIGADAASFAGALRSALREDPDIILVGEMRDHETISAALTAAETGHLVLSTLHTTGAAQTIDRIIDAFPTQSQSQVRIQLAGVLLGVITQNLIPRSSGGRIPATELLLGTDAVLNLIRENKCHQLSTVMQVGASVGMHTLNGCLVRLLRAGKITREDAEKYSDHVKDLQQLLH